MHRNKIYHFPEVSFLPPPTSFIEIQLTQNIVLVLGVQYNDLICIVKSLSQKLTPTNSHSYKVFFLVMRTFKGYSLSSLQIYSTVLLTMVTMLYITSPSQTFCSQPVTPRRPHVEVSSVHGTLEYLFTRCFAKPWRTQNWRLHSPYQSKRNATLQGAPVEHDSKIAR